MWGSNNTYQLGLSDTRIRRVYRPQILQLPTKLIVNEKSAGERVLLAASKSASGSSGSESTSSREPPLEAAQVACGGRHTVLLLRDGQLLGWGDASFGQLGHARTQYEASDAYRTLSPPAQMQVHFAAPRLLDLWPGEQVTHRTRRVVQVACGHLHTVLRLADGSVATLGANTYGQLGTGNRQNCAVARVLSGIENATLVAAGANHTIVCSGLQKWSHLLVAQIMHIR